MRRAVERCNCLVDVARDGIEAMDKINRHADPQFPDYQIVFLDIGLPRMDGVGVLRYIKTMAAPLHVVLVTGSATKAQLDEAAKLGYFGFIEKPLESKGVAEIFQKHKIPHFDPGI
jgi:CheY-like chemotaxis protein